MIRRNNKKPSAILTSDWHLREDTPVCRKEEDFQDTQWSKVQFVKQLQEKYDCPVFHAGDLFHHWKPSPWLLYKTMQNLPASFHSIYGNHDLPQHSLELSEKSGLNVLIASGHVKLLEGTHWGSNEPTYVLPFEGRKLLIWHTMTFSGELPYPGCEDLDSNDLLKMYASEYDLILTGHNHKAFTASYKGSVLVNPGSIMRQDADQVDFEPRVYLWYAETNEVKPVFLPILPGNVTREHLEKNKEREDRIEAFISTLDTDFSSSLSFEKNLEQFLQKNSIRSSVKDIIYKAVER